jgi:hypothetical protein
VNLPVTQKSNVVCGSARFPIPVPPRFFCVGCSALAPRSALGASTSTRCRSLSSSVEPLRGGWCSRAQPCPLHESERRETDIVGPTHHPLTTPSATRHESGIAGRTPAFSADGRSHEIEPESLDLTEGEYPASLGLRARNVSGGAGVAAAVTAVTRFLTPWSVRY